VDLQNLLPLSIVFAALLVASAIAYFVNPVVTGGFFQARIAFLCRLWKFWGPRLTDRTFIGAIITNLVVLNIVDVKTADAWQLALWLGANLIFPVWDHLPAGEKLAPPRTARLSVAADQEALRETLRSVIDEYTPARAAA
jgi:hypothetical protein